MYLAQGAALMVRRDMIASDWQFVPIGLFATIVVAKGMHVVNSKVLFMLTNIAHL